MDGPVTLRRSAVEGDPASTIRLHRLHIPPEGSPSARALITGQPPFAELTGSHLSGGTGCGRLARQFLYAQPGTRIVCLTVDDVLDDRATVTVRRGNPSSPLPEPVADLIWAYVQSCQHLPYASGRSSQWLCPGRQAGKPMNPVSLQVHLRKIGVARQRGRTSAIPRLVLQALAPVIAKALGYHGKTATRLVTEAGGTWSRYAPATTHGDTRTDLT